MGKYVPEEERNTNDQQKYEKMFKFTANQRNAN